MQAVERRQQSGLKVREFAEREGLTASVVFVALVKHAWAWYPREAQVEAVGCIGGPVCADDAERRAHSRGRSAWRCDSVAGKHRCGVSRDVGSQPGAALMLTLPLPLPRSVKIYLSSLPMDTRRGHDGLFAVVRSWGLEPFLCGA